jgi:hypothetical protein
MPVSINMIYRVYRCLQSNDRDDLKCENKERKKEYEEDLELIKVIVRELPAECLSRGGCNEAYDGQAHLLNQLTHRLCDNPTKLFQKSQFRNEQK